MLSYSVYCKNSCIINLKEITNMKRFLAAMALACVLSASALAGEISTSGFMAPQPGEIPTSGVASSPAPATTETAIGDDVIANLLETLCALVF
jgi:hypothetical protein